MTDNYNDGLTFEEIMKAIDSVETSKTFEDITKPKKKIALYTATMGIKPFFGTIAANEQDNQRVRRAV